MSADEWQDRAACKGAPIEWFFPDRGESLAPAQAVCNTCTVTAECLAESSVQYLGIPTAGVWGGMSARQRKLKKQTDDQPLDDRRSA